MVRRRSCAVSNHEGGLILRDAAEWPLLRMRSLSRPRQIENPLGDDAEHHLAGAALDRIGLGAQPGARPGAWLRTKANSIEGGTSEVMLGIVAKRILDLPG